MVAKAAMPRKPGSERIVTTIHPEDVSSKLAEVAKACVALTADATDTKRVEELLHTYFKNVAPADIQRRSVDELLGLVKSHFEIAKRLPVGQGTVDLAGVTTIDYDNPLAFDLYAADEAEPANLRFKMFSAKDPVTLTKVMPHLTNMGVEVADERAYEITLGEHKPLVYDLGLKVAGAESWTEADRTRFEQVFQASYTGALESDGLNALVGAGLDAKQIGLLRAISRWLQQAGVVYSQETIAKALVANQKIARMLVTVFEQKFDPAGPIVAERKGTVDAAFEAIAKELETVQSLDDDQIIRHYVTFLKAAIRTNYFQEGNEALGIKILPREIAYLPEPRPMFEIVVYSPRVEGVHLRYGMVARGGLRWSDRRDDFRTEILGLVKAQMVKNTVIVPVGAKGGFFPKQLPNPAIDRAGWQAEGIASYKIFINTLLSMTDNIVKGEVTHQPNVINWDGDDPYLVVAADKGTATFSDIANGISLDRGHWLGDAFASGGSIGYDHKGMGITARGAWESVKRHFAELGKDCQSEDFTVVGVGDMAGDVFGNGALLSEHGRWIAVFNHMHIFIDPTPDAAKSFAERKRMFDDRLGWDQYNKDLISAGGGVFERSMKSIPLSAEAKKALGIDPAIESMSPTELIHAILLAPVELVYNGGIGTYLKATEETHAQASDKANDATRVNGKELRCKIFGEGGNLGCTQLGRVEAAKHGIKINTDFIDNSAGVDTSDHEVNIKILFAQEIEAGRCTMEQRNQILPQMTDEVAQLVLSHNVMQNKALQNENVKAAELAAEHEAWMVFLEERGYMDRPVQFMPSSAQMADRIAKGEGLTNPEFCNLLSWTKIYFEDAILECSILDDEAFTERLVNYFPTLLRQNFADAMLNHRLRREIVATELVNEFVDTMGITAFQRLTKATGKNLDEILRAFFSAKKELGFDVDAQPQERVAQAGAIEKAMLAKLG